MSRQIHRIDPHSDEIRVHLAEPAVHNVAVPHEVGQAPTAIRLDDPVAETVSPLPGRSARPFGLFAGEIVIDEGFDDPLPAEITRAFSGIDR